MKISLLKNRKIFFISLTLFIGSTTLCGVCFHKVQHKAIAAINTEKLDTYSDKFLKLDTLRKNFSLAPIEIKEYNSLKESFSLAATNLDFIQCESLLKDIELFLKSSTQIYFAPIKKDFEFYYMRPFNNLSSDTLSKLETLKKDFYLACDNLDLSLAKNLFKDAKKLVVENNKTSLKKKYKNIDLSDATKVKEPICINDVLIVNKDYALPSTYDPGNKKEALEAFNKMKIDARKSGIYIDVGSSYRSYNNQFSLFNNYSNKNGLKKANTFSAKAGHSEHQSGLTFDIVGENSKTDINSNFDNTKESKWLKENAHKYGFILRFPKDKENITGYIYESWHYRYIGVEHSKHFNNNNLTLEEYLGLA